MMDANLYAKSVEYRQERGIIVLFRAAQDTSHLMDSRKVKQLQRARQTERERERQREREREREREM